MGMNESNWPSQSVKRPGNCRIQHAEIWTPYHNYRQKGKSNGWFSMENLRIHGLRNVSGFVQNDGEIPPWIRRTSMVSPHLEACRGTLKGTKTSNKENSFMGNIIIWRQTIWRQYKYLNKIHGTESRILPLELSDRTRGYQMKLKK